MFSVRTGKKLSARLQFPFCMVLFVPIQKNFISNRKICIEDFQIYLFILSNTFEGLGPWRKKPDGFSVLGKLPFDPTVFSFIDTQRQCHCLRQQPFKFFDTTCPKNQWYHAM